MFRKYILVLYILSGCSDNEHIESQTVINIQDIDISILVSEPVSPIIPLDRERRYGDYKWLIPTKVSVKSEKVKIIIFGGFIYSDFINFNQINRTFGAEEFERWYNCPGSVLIPGNDYIDSNNWFISEKLHSTDKLGVLFFIGKTDLNQKIMGYEFVELSNL